MGTAIVAQKNALLEMIEKNEAAITESLPKHITPERMLRVARTAIQTTPSLWECHPQSIISALVEASTLGLEPNGTLGEAALVPFRNKHTKRKECQLMVMYRGYIELADRTGKVEYVDAEIVYKDDIFEFEQGSNPSLKHVKKLGGKKTEADIIGAYALVMFLTEKSKFVVLDVAEIEKIRNCSKAKNGDAWRTWWAEMAKKTALRRLFKYTRLSPELSRASVLADAIDGGVIAAGGQQPETTSFDGESTTDALKERLKQAQAAVDAADDEDNTIDAESVEELPEADADGVVIEKEDAASVVTPNELNSAGEPSKFASAFADMRLAFGEADREEAFTVAVERAMNDHELDDINAATQAQKKKIIAYLASTLKAGAR